VYVQRETEIKKTTAREATVPVVLIDAILVKREKRMGVYQAAFLFTDLAVLYAASCSRISLRYA
jgi:hypothetical protein